MFGVIIEPIWSYVVMKSTMTHLRKETECWSVPWKISILFTIVVIGKQFQFVGWLKIQIAVELIRTVSYFHCCICTLAGSMTQTPRYFATIFSLFTVTEQWLRGYKIADTVLGPIFDTGVTYSIVLFSISPVFGTWKCPKVKVKIKKKNNCQLVTQEGSAQILSKNFLPRKKTLDFLF